MPPTDAKYRITGTIKGQQVWFFRQESDGVIQFVDLDDLRLATWFSSTQAIERCRNLREMGKDVRVVSADGTVCFEDESRPPLPPDDCVDRRDFLFYRPDDGSPLGYVIAPATTPELGRCWSMRCQDQVALNGRIVESVYDKDPASCVGKFLLILKQGGVDCPPGPRPDQDRLDHAELLGVIRDIKRSQNRTLGNTRPGDR
jgi:hypothetical protein